MTLHDISSHWYQGNSAGQELQQEEKMGKDWNKHVHHLARTIAGQLRFPMDTIAGSKSRQELARRLYDLYAQKLREGIIRLRWSPAMLREVAFCGRGVGARDGVTLWDVHGRDWLHQMSTGEYFLREIALTTIIAAMANNIWADQQKTEDQG